VQVSAKQLVTGASFVLWNREKEQHRRQKNKIYEGSGTLRVGDARVVREYSFLEYLEAGFEMNLMVGIDFTASNQDPRIPSSLHFTGQVPSEMNQYEKAIVGVGEVLAPYDADQVFPVFGFGGKPPGSSVVNHCFPLDSEARGVQGILNAYRKGIHSVALYGPTYFAPLIRNCAGWVSQRPNKYVILLIITDGEIMDMDETKRAIVETSHLPYSVVIVGVGSADFTSMKELDGDERRLSFLGREVTRDVVQFVAFRELSAAVPSVLAEYVCAEIPSQFLQFAKSYNITPDSTRALARSGLANPSRS
jgi:hypothetical protein